MTSARIICASARSLERLRPRRILACTATATRDVRRQIRDHLHLGEECHEVLRGFARPNLHLAARNIEGPKEAKRAVASTRSARLSVRRGHRVAAQSSTRRPESRRSSGPKGSRRRDGTRPRTTPECRRRSDRRIAARFADRSLDLVVATNAFGMGIDRADIRAVVHVQPPASIEAYYQEVGRAGRDGAEASGLLLCSGADVGLRRRLVTTSSDGGPAAPETAARAWALFRELLRYLDARTCRHDFILRYFGDEQELLGGCGHCDICAALETSAGDATAEGDDGEKTSTAVRMALSAVARARGRAGVIAVADMLHGVDDERTRRFGFTGLSTFGLLRERSHPWVLDLLRGLLAAGWIDLTPTDHPVPYLTPQGDEVMRAKGPVRFALPVDGAKRARGASAQALGPRRKKSGSTRPPRSIRSTSTRAGASNRLRARIERRSRAPAGVPSYVVAFDRTLVEMAARQPRSRDELLAIHGMGPARADSYGEGFLEVLRG